MTDLIKGLVKTSKTNKSRDLQHLSKDKLTKDLTSSWKDWSKAFDNGPIRYCNELLKHPLKGKQKLFWINVLLGNRCA